MHTGSLSTMETTARFARRAALAGYVVEVLYHAWQRGRSLTLAEIVHGVRAADADAPLVEIHRAIGHLECSGLIDYDPPGRWRRNSDTGSRPWPVAVCGKQGCVRPDDHDGGHLPDLGTEDLVAELVVHHTDFMAACSTVPGTGFVRVYADPHDWAADNDPIAFLEVPADTEICTAVLLDMLAGWLAEGSPTSKDEEEHG